MKITRKILTLTILTTLMLIAFAITGFAAEKSGNMLNNGSLTYSFEDGVLTIEGSADRLRFDSALSWDCKGSIWHDEGWSEDITEVVVNASVGYIDKYVLSLLPSCTRITIPASVTGVDIGGFAGNPSLLDIRVSGADYSELGEGHFYDLRNFTEINGYSFDGTGENSTAPTLLLGSGSSIFFEKFMQNCYEQTVTFYVYPDTNAEIQVIEAAIKTLENDPYYYICDNIYIKYYASSIAANPLSGEIITSSDPAWSMGIAWELDIESGTLFIKNSNGNITFKEYAHEEGFITWKNTWKNAVKRIEVGTFEKICTWSLLSEYPYCREMLFTAPFTCNGNLPNNKRLTTIGLLSGYEENVIDISLLRYPNESWADGAELLYGSSSVTSVKFPEENLMGVYFTGAARLFYECSKLESITLPSYITKLGSEIFSGCAALKEVHIGNADISIASDAFGGCKGVTLYADSFVNAEKLNNTLREAGIDPSIATAVCENDAAIIGGMSFVGYQVRISEYNGLRSIFSYDETAFGLNEGFNFVEYGTIAATAKNYSSYTESVGGDNSILILKDGEFVTQAENIVKTTIRDTVGYHNKFAEGSDGTVSFNTVIVRYKNEEHIKTDVIIAGYEIWERDGVYYALFTKGDYESYGNISLYKATLGMLSEELIGLGRSIGSPIWQTLVSCESTALDISIPGLSALAFADPANEGKNIAVFLNDSGEEIALEGPNFLASSIRSGLSGYVFEETIIHDFPIHYNYTDIVERLVDAEHLAMGNKGETSKEFSSYDRDSRIVDGSYVDWNANDDFGGYIRKEADGGYVIAEMEGAGYISRIWSASPGTGHIKIFIDGENVPTIDMPFKDVFSGSVAPFNYPMLSYNTDSGQGKNCYVPITYNESCRVVVYDDWGEYYLINYTTLAKGCFVESMPKELSSTQKNALGRVNDMLTDITGSDIGGSKDPEFESFTVTSESSAVKTLNGSGSIRGLLIDVDYEGYNNAYETVLLFKHLRIKIYWDGMDTPFVDAPLGDFFGSAYGVTDIRTLMLGVRDDGIFYNYFPMPYLEEARIEISYLGSGSIDLSLAVNVEELNDEDIMYYCAIFTQGEYDENPEKHPDYHFLSVNGSGKIVGITLHSSKCTNEVDPESAPGSPWWGEGDEKFYIDGEPFPSWYGTGTEDFFGYAWCDGTLFNRAYHSQSYCVGGANSKGNRSVTRIMLTDCIPFEQSFEGYFEKYYGDDHVKFGFTTYFYMSADSVAEHEDYTKEEIESYFYFDPGVAATNFTEAEHLRVTSLTKGGSYYVQSMSYFGTYWSENNHLMITGLAEGGSIEFVLPAESDGKYVALASFTYAPDYGRVRVGINGNMSDTVFDLYDPSVNADVLSYLGEFDINGGFSNTLTVNVDGKNQSSTNYYVGIDFVILVPAEEFTTLAEFDLSPYTSVIRTNTKQTN